jgi:hypothetical protein
MAVSRWLLAKTESQSNDLKFTVFDKQLIHATAGQRTRFLAALGMTSLEMSKANSQRPAANSQRPHAISQRPSAMSPVTQKAFQEVLLREGFL